MVLAAPFTEYYYEIIEAASERMGKKHFLVNSDGDIEEVGFSVRIGIDRLVYNAFSEFMAKFEAILPVGHVNHWFSEEDFNTWIHTLIYFSFIHTSQSDNQIRWFANMLGGDSLYNVTLMPNKVMETLIPYKNDKWVLLKCGKKVYPVQIVESKMEKGWPFFWDDHDLKPNFKLIFESESQVIFNVIILDQNLTCVEYKWTNPDADHIITPPSSEASTSSLFQARLEGIEYIGFGHIYNGYDNLIQDLERRLSWFLEDNIARNIFIAVGNETFVVAKEENHLHSLCINMMTETLALKSGDFLYIAGNETAEILMVVFEHYGLERSYA